MSQAALKLQPVSTKWTVLSGPASGSVHIMSAPHFTVGRSTECELVIVQDPKCSRKHATISSTPNGHELVSLNENNPVLVNGSAVERGPLQDGDVVTFGETEVRFQSSVSTEDVQLALVQPRPFAPAEPSVRMPGYAPNKKNIGNFSTSPNNKRLYIYGLLGLVVLWLALPSKNKKKESQLRTEQQISQSEIETGNKLKELADAEAMRRNETSIPARQAQENFVRGFRDYRKGQFERSLMAFQSCLALNPEHVLCNRYFRLARRKFDELVQYEILLGRRYREQNQFRACRAAYRNVMVMVKDPNAPIYQEAKANYEACDSLTEGRF